MFCGDNGNTATIRNGRFYLADGEMVRAPREFRLSDCVDIRKAKDLDKNARLAAKVAAWAMC